MADKQGALFTDRFFSSLTSLIEAHHSVYPILPPQGIFFESLVERAFKQLGWPDAQVVLTTANSPKHDLLVGDRRISLKTETGLSTKPHIITITKLCTTEKEPWDSSTLVRHVLVHLSRYDCILMLRAIWKPGAISYQLIEIPLPLLRLIAGIIAESVGWRSGRRSLGADVYEGQEKVFHVHFDGSDGKCQVRQLLVSRCQMLREWQHLMSDETWRRYSHLLDLRNTSQ
jgi:hypothetical protein